METPTEPLPVEDYAPESEFDGNDAPPVVIPPLKPSGEPMSLEDFGVEPRDVPLSFVKWTSKAQKIRVLERMPVPDAYKVGNPEKNPGVYVRFRVEMETGEHRVWDVGSKRALALLSGIPNLRDWFTVARQGRGTSTTYEILPATGASE